ncbi:MAG: tetratricopeptide repeat protein [Sandaracinaceae bacterium]
MAARAKCLGFGILGALPFAGGLGFQHVYDDHWTIVDNPTLRHPLPEILRALWSGRAQGIPDASRPAMVVTAWLDHRLFGASSVGTHLTSLALYLACVGALASLAFSLTRSRALAFTTALLWGVMPLHAEAVVSASYREDLLATLGVFAGLAVVLRPTATPHGWGRAATAAGCFALGLLGKESGLVLVPLLLALGPWDRAFWTRRERSLTALAAVALLYLSWRFGLAVAGDGVARADVSGFAALNASARYVCWSVWRSATPFETQAFFSDLGDASPLWWLPVLALVGAWVGLRSRAPAVATALAILVIGAWMTSPLIGPVNERADRYLVISTAGTALLWAMGVARVVRRLRRERAWVRPALIAGPIALALGIQAHLASAVWTNDERLWTHGTEAAPSSPGPWDGLAWARRQRRDLDGAERALARAEALDPDRAQTRLSRAYLLLLTGRREEAMDVLGQLEREAPPDPAGGPELRGLSRARRCAGTASDEAMGRCLGERWATEARR